MKFKDTDDFLFEMANLSKRRFKSLPANMFISAKGHAKHGPRIKIQQNSNERVQSELTFSMTVPDKKIIGNTGKLDNDAIEYFRKFIDVNKDVLTDYWYNGHNLDTLDVIESLIFDL